MAEAKSPGGVGCLSQEADLSCSSAAEMYIKCMIPGFDSHSIKFYFSFFSAKSLA